MKQEKMTRLRIVRVDKYSKMGKRWELEDEREKKMAGRAGAFGLAYSD